MGPLAAGASEPSSPTLRMTRISERALMLKHNKCPALTDRLFGAGRVAASAAGPGGSPLWRFLESR